MSSLALIAHVSANDCELSDTIVHAGDDMFVVTDTTKCANVYHKILVVRTESIIK